MTAPKDRAGVVALIAGGSTAAIDEQIAASILADMEAAGLRVVPTVLTTTMLDAGNNARSDDTRTGELWAALLAASPFGPPPEGDA